MPDALKYAAEGTGLITGSYDAAVQHPWAFVFMFVLVLLFGVGRVAKETTQSVKKWGSFVHLWMLGYLVLLAFLMSVTTGMALVLLIDEKGQPRLSFLPPSMMSMAAAVVGVFGFEFLFRKFVIGFGENQFDLSVTLDNFVDQAVAATLKKEAGG
jgi:hypothetical protein